MFNYVQNKMAASSSLQRGASRDATAFPSINSQLSSSMSNMGLNGRDTSSPEQTRGVLSPSGETPSLDEQRAIQREIDRSKQSSPTMSRGHSENRYSAGQRARKESTAGESAEASSSQTHRKPLSRKPTRDGEGDGKQGKLHMSRNASAQPLASDSKTGRSRDDASKNEQTRSGQKRTLRAYHTREMPHLPSAPNVKPAPPPAMYWSKAPVHGAMPHRSFRAHSATLCDEMLWLFGGCDAKGCFQDLWCFDTETMCWSKPSVSGTSPPPRRAHSATMVDRRLFVFAGGDGPYYFNDLYVFDTVDRTWSKPDVFGQPPSPRRAHTSNYYNGNLIIFGGGNGVGALNDVHLLDVSNIQRLEWHKVECSGNVPIGRGYHTSNLVDGKLIVIGGSDGHTSFDDIHILKLDTQVWYQVGTDEAHCRLGHTATQVGSYLFVVGGYDSQKYSSDLLTLNLVNLQWEPRRVCGAVPAGRGYHQAWLRDGRLFVHGGFDGKAIFDDLYCMDLGACAYLPQITSFSIELDDE